jgi:hypothetical protein
LAKCHPDEVQAPLGWCRRARLCADPVRIARRATGEGMAPVSTCHRPTSRPPRPPLRLPSRSGRAPGRRSWSQRRSTKGCSPACVGSTSTRRVPMCRSTALCHRCRRTRPCVRGLHRRPLRGSSGRSVSRSGWPRSAPDRRPMAPRRLPPGRREGAERIVCACPLQRQRLGNRTRRSTGFRVTAASAFAPPELAHAAPLVVATAGHGVA